MTEQQRAPTHEGVLEAISVATDLLAADETSALFNESVAALLHAAKIGARFMAPGAREEIARVIVECAPEGDPDIAKRVDAGSDDMEFWLYHADAILSHFLGDTNDR